MSNHEERLERLKKDLSQVQSRSAVAKAEKERLTKELKEVLKELKALGYSSFDEAKEGLKELEKATTTALEEAEAHVASLRSKL